MIWFLLLIILTGLAGFLGFFGAATGYSGFAKIIFYVLIAGLIFLTIFSIINWYRANVGPQFETGYMVFANCSIYKA